jgi:hypothetical protein
MLGWILLAGILWVSCEPWNSISVEVNETKVLDRIGFSGCFQLMSLIVPLRFDG